MQYKYTEGNYLLWFDEIESTENLNYMNLFQWNRLEILVLSYLKLAKFLSTQVPHLKAFCENIFIFILPVSDGSVVIINFGILI